MAELVGSCPQAEQFVVYTAREASWTTATVVVWVRISSLHGKIAAVSFGNGRVYNMLKLRSYNETALLSGLN